MARRITEIEKPAHTTFEVKLYFALFRVGEAQFSERILCWAREAVSRPFCWVQPVLPPGI